MHRQRRNIPSLLWFGLAALACSPEQLPTPGPRSPLRPAFDLAGGPGSVGVCLSGQQTSLPAESLPSPLAAGDYYTGLVVDQTTTQAGDGRHFTRITDAIAAVRSGRMARGERTAPQAACRITISVAPGTYTGSYTADPGRELFPLVLDVPRLTLEGGLRMRLDGRGRATGLAQNPADVSVLRPFGPLAGTQAILIVTDSSAGLRGDGVQDIRGDSVTIRGFAFQSGHSSGGGAGFAIFALRATGLRIEENRFETLLASAADLRASTAVLERNSAMTLSPGACTFCFGGPGNYDFRANQVVQSGLVGVLTTPVAPLTTTPGPAGLHPFALPAETTVTGVIENNLVRDNTRAPVGTAIRIVTHGNTGAGLIPQATGFSIEDNELIHNRFGMILDAGFPPAGLNPGFPTGDLDATLSGNIFAGSCETNLLVAFTRHTRGMGLTTPAAFSGALRNSEYVLTLNGNIPWASVWYHHPAVDSGVTLNNTLTVDHATILSGTVHAYNPAACAAAPVGNTGGPYTGSEGGSVTFNGAASTGTGLSYAWTFGDGSTGSGPAPSHIYADDGVYEVTLVVTDGTGVSSLPSITTATIANVAPVVGPVSGPVGPTPIAVSVAVSAPFSDAGLADVHTATIDWGDGTTTAGTGTGTGTVFGTHAYAAAGTYQVTVTVTDEEPAAGSATLSGVVIEGVNSPSAVWIGLKNSDDVGTSFDLLAEVLRDGSVIATGQLNGVPGGSSGFNNAVQRTIAAALTTAPGYAAGDVLGIRLSVRIAVGVPGHSSGTARLWYGDAAANSSLTTLVNGVGSTWYLDSGFSLAATPGAGPKRFVDVLVNKKVGGNPFKPFGTWSRTF